MLTYLTCPSVQNSFIDFRKEEPVSNFRPSRFLYRGQGIFLPFAGSTWDQYRN